MEIQMQLCRILITETREYQLIELREVDGERRLPIVIGLFEAAAIERRLKNIVPPRPQTHDLLADVIHQMGGELVRIRINDMRNDTFYARLVIRRGDEEIQIDARPSDAIALGIANDIPIFVEERVLDAANSG